MLALLVPGVHMGGGAAAQGDPVKSLCATGSRDAAPCATGSRGNTLCATGSANG